jgi:hypothetical protein
MRRFRAVGLERADKLVAPEQFDFPYETRSILSVKRVAQFARSGQIPV